MVAGAVVVKVNLVEEAMEANLATESVDVKYKVAEAELVTVVVEEEDTMKTKGSNLTLNFPLSQNILTLNFLHLMTKNGIMN